jgi:hypothetical protein
MSVEELLKTKVQLLEHHISIPQQLQLVNEELTRREQPTEEDNEE